MVQVSILVDTDQGQYLLVVVILLIFFYKCIAISLFLLNWRETSSSASTVVVDHTNLPGNLNSHSSNVRMGSSHTRWQDTISPFARPTSATSTVIPRPHYFKFQLFPGKFMKIQFDRLVLLALMDRYGVFCGLHKIICFLVTVLGISRQSAICIFFTGDYDSFGYTKNFDLYCPSI